MKTLNEFRQSIQILFTDIDDTMTDDGFLGPEAYAAMWDLNRVGIKVVPVTGRPAGWCEMIARQWPVVGVIGENGGFYFMRVQNDDGTTGIKRHFEVTEEFRLRNRKKLDRIAEDAQKIVPGCAIASDQFSRLMDLAIDFREDVRPLPKGEVQKIVEVFLNAGAHAKISSIHVNGWFGDYNKVSTTQKFLKSEFHMSLIEAQTHCAFIGDSPNDEPMFEFFPNSFGVANIQTFLPDLTTPPTYVASQTGGKGFAEIAKALIAIKKK